MINDMNTSFQARNIELNQEMKTMMVSKVEGLNKFFSPDTQVFIDVEKTRSSQNGDDLYYTSVTVVDGKERYFSEEHEENIRKSFDVTYQEIFRMVRDERSRTRRLARKAGASLKKLFRRSG
jgi:ribosome-associated translation inhibitor RaiA